MGEASCVKDTNLVPERIGGRVSVVGVRMCSEMVDGLADGRAAKLAGRRLAWGGQPGGWKRWWLGSAQEWSAVLFPGKTFGKSGWPLVAPHFVYTSYVFKEICPPRCTHVPILPARPQESFLLSSRPSTSEEALLLTHPSFTARSRLTSYFFLHRSPPKVCQSGSNPYLWK